MKLHEKVSTGMTGFDKTIDMLRMGDNVVWQIDCNKDYQKVIAPYIIQARKDRRKTLKSLMYLTVLQNYWNSGIQIL